MELPAYNPEGKKLTTKQHRKKKEKWENKPMKTDDTETEAIGRCPNCKRSRFKLFMRNHELIRCCQECGAEKVF